MSGRSEQKRRQFHIEREVTSARSALAAELLKVVEDLRSQPNPFGFPQNPGNLVGIGQAVDTLRVRLAELKVEVRGDDNG